jgi:hypothetical protein
MRPWIVCAATGVLVLGSFGAIANDGTGKGHQPIALRSAGPQMSSQQIGRITSVDPAAMTIGCHWSTGDWTYQTSAKTTFKRGGSAASFADLKAGDVVQVLFHMEGTAEVADAVMISN